MCSYQPRPGVRECAGGELPPPRHRRHRLPAEPTPGPRPAAAEPAPGPRPAAAPRPLLPLKLCPQSVLDEGDREGALCPLELATILRVVFTDWVANPYDFCTTYVLWDNICLA